MQMVLSEQKNILTNLVAAGVLLAGLVLPPSLYHELMVNAGVFALAGALTNWLAIYMLFERVPLLYGSGVIERQFDKFKDGIKSLILKQFFSKDNVMRFLDSEHLVGSTNQFKDKMIAQISLDEVFDKLVETIGQSSFAGMLQMVGGLQIFEPMREPIKAKLQQYIEDLFADEQKLHLFDAEEVSHNVTHQIEMIVEQRLNELTPKMVKNIIQEMIRKHLGWLVVWGGVFGGLIGVLASLLIDL